MKKLLITALLLTGAHSMQAGAKSFFGGMFTGSALTNMTHAANNNRSYGHSCDCSEYRYQLKVAQDDVRNLERENDKLQNRVKRLERENNKLKNRVTRLERENDSLRKKAKRSS